MSAVSREEKRVCEAAFHITRAGTNQSSSHTRVTLQLEAMHYRSEHQLNGTCIAIKPCISEPANAVKNGCRLTSQLRCVAWYSMVRCCCSVVMGTLTPAVRALLDIGLKWLSVALPKLRSGLLAVVCLNPPKDRSTGAGSYSGKKLEKRSRPLYARKWVFFS